MNSYTMETLYVGQSVEQTFEITQELVERYAEVSGDFNPVHLDEEYAKGTRFGRRIAHGMLTGAFISRMVGMELPGEGVIYMKQDLTFLRPVYHGDSIRIVLTVTELDHNKKRAVLSTNCYNQNGEQVIAGTALTKPREV